MFSRRTPEVCRSSPVDRWVPHLERAVGADRVIVDGDRLLSFAGDESAVAPVLPGAVLRVRDEGEVAAALRVAHEHRVPVTARGAGTGKAGGCVPSPSGLVIDLCGLAKVLDVDRDSLTAEVQPGVITGDFRDQVADLGLFYPPDPNSLVTCTLGGNVATNAGGPCSMKYGVTRDYVLGLDLILANGEQRRVGRRTHKGVVGYDLAALVVGSEGTLGIVTRMTLRLRPLPREVRTALGFFPDVGAAARAVAELAGIGLDLRVAELIDGYTLDAGRVRGGLRVPDGAGAALLLELDGELADSGDIDQRLEIVGEALLRHRALEVMVAASDRERAAVWTLRRDLSVAVKEGYSHWISEDVGVPRAKVPELIEAVGRIRRDAGLTIATYGHAGEGNLHVNILWDDPADAARAEAASAAVFRVALDLGGTVSGEHGIGSAKVSYVSWEQTPEVIALQREIKRLFDPLGILNPGKVLP